MKHPYTFSASLIAFLLCGLSFTGNAQVALHFDGIDDYVHIDDDDANRIVVNDFTLEFWMRTTQTGPTGSHWFHGNGIVDAEVSGVSNDWGVSLAGSKLAFGIGNPDKTIFSNADVNTGDWIHVAVNWHANESMRIYINGVLDEQSGGVPFQDRTARNIRFGCLQTGINFYNGALAQVRFYNGNLGAAQIQNDMYCTHPSTTDAYYTFSDGVAGQDNTAITHITDSGFLAQGGNATLNNFARTGTASNFVDFSIVGISSDNTVADGTLATFSSDIPAGSPLYRWQIDEGAGFANIDGATASTYATDALQPDDEIRLVVLGSSCGLAFGLSSNIIVMTGLVLSNHIWTGATSTDWSTATNWSTGTVPTASDDVEIPSLPANQPIVSGDLAACASVTVDAGASLSIAAANALTVHGDLINTGTVRIEADASGIGSLITFGSISGSGTFIAQQYLKGAGGATPNGVFHYVSTPVTGATAAVYDLASGNKLWSADETTQTYPLIADGATALNAGQGYVVRMGATDVYSLNGATFNTGPVALNGLTRSGADGNFGYNLIGNPYPSSLSWDDAITDNMQPSIWYRTHTAGEAMTFDVYNAQSGIGTGNNRFGEDADGLVPPGQGFWVRVVDGESLGSVTFNNTMRSHGTQAQLYKLAEEEGTVRMRLMGPNGSDEAIVHFTSEAQDGPDAYDSHKMWGAAALAQVYTTTGADTVAINGLQSIATNPVVDLGVRLPSAGDYSFHAHSITLSENVWLEDRLLNTFQHLNEDPTYSFTSEAGNHGSRFALHFGALAVGAGRGVACNVCTQVFAADGVVNVLVGDDNAKGSVTILDMMGRAVQTAVINGSRTVVAADLVTGIYLVHVETAKGAETHRVMLR